MDGAPESPWRLDDRARVVSGAGERQEGLRVDPPDLQLERMDLRECPVRAALVAGTAGGQRGDGLLSGHDSRGSPLESGVGVPEPAVPDPWPYRKLRRQMDPAGSQHRHLEGQALDLLRRASHLSQRPGRRWSAHRHRPGHGSAGSFRFVDCIRSIGLGHHPAVSGRGRGSRGQPGGPERRTHRRGAECRR